MYPSRVAESLGMLGETNRLESDLICFLKFTAQETRIQDAIAEGQKTQTEEMRVMLDDMKAKLGRG
jgi:hypothetical protein